MEPAFLGLVIDSSIVIDAERKRQTVDDLLTTLRQRFGEVEVVISALTVAELVHGIERADTLEIRQRRRALIGGRQAAHGIKLPIDDLLIGVTALEQGYAVATLNLRRVKKIPELTVVSACIRPNGKLSRPASTPSDLHQ